MGPVPFWGDKGSVQERLDQQIHSNLHPMSKSSMYNSSPGSCCAVAILCSTRPKLLQGLREDGASKQWPGTTEQSSFACALYSPLRCRPWTQTQHRYKLLTRPSWLSDNVNFGSSNNVGALCMTDPFRMEDFGHLGFNQEAFKKIWSVSVHVDCFSASVVRHVNWAVELCSPHSTCFSLGFCLRKV